MVQKESSRRGRPRKYDRADVLKHARNVFAESGYEMASLDVICARANINKSTLYAAFGDKKALYFLSMAAYQQELGQAIRAMLAMDKSLATILEEMFGIFRAYYFPGAPLGCLVMGTTATIAPGNEDVRQVLSDVIRDLDHVLIPHCLQAQKTGEISRTVPAEGLARIISAHVQSLSLRARAGADREIVDILLVDLMQVLGLENHHQTA